MSVTKILQEQAGIQYAGVLDKSESNRPDSLANFLFVGEFKRGQMNMPVKVTKENIRALLGHDPENPHYCAVEDALRTGAPFVWVQRVILAGSGEYEDIGNSCSTHDIEFTIDNIIPVDLNKRYAIFGEIKGPDNNIYTINHNIELSDNVDEINGQTYMTVGRLMNNFYDVFYGYENLTGNMLPTFLLNVDQNDEAEELCSIYDSSITCSLRSSTNSWDSIAETTYAISLNGQSRSVTMPAASFSRAGLIYTYMMDLYAQLAQVVPEIGLVATILDDTTFKDGSHTSFNPSYFPDIVFKGYVHTDVISITDNNSAYLLQGYNGTVGCNTFKDFSEISISRSGYFAPYTPMESELEYAIPLKSTIKINTTTPEKDGVINILKLANMSKQIVSNLCFAINDREQEG